VAYSKEPKIAIKDAMYNDTCCSCGIYSDKVAMKRVFIGNFAFAICRGCRDILADQFSDVDNWGAEIEDFERNKEKQAIVTTTTTQCPSQTSDKKKSKGAIKP
jgi:hypothetical protein